MEESIEIHSAMNQSPNHGMATHGFVSILIIYNAPYPTCKPTFVVVWTRFSVSNGRHLPTDQLANVVTVSKANCFTVNKITLEWTYHQVRIATNPWNRIRFFPSEILIDAVEDH